MAQKSRKSKRPTGREEIHRPDWRFPVFAIAVTALLGGTIYSNTYDVPFIFDDQWNISENPHIRIQEWDLSKLWQALTLSPNASRPVAHFSFVMNYYFGGYEVASYHVVNLVVHILNGVLIYFLSRFTLGRINGLSPPSRRAGSSTSDRQNSWLALAAACIFVAHPLQTQAVTYIVQRMTSMASLFYLLSLWLYILGRVEANVRRRTAYWAGGFVSFLLAVGSKQIAATLPLAILVYEWFFFQDLGTEWLRRRLKYVVAAAALFFVVGLIYLGPDPFERVIGDYEVRDFTLAERLMTQPRVVWLYISLLLYPNPNRLNLLHDVSIAHSLINPPTTLLAILGITGLIVLAMLIARRERLLSFCILWFFLQLVIESSVIPLELVFEHRVYLPMWGFALAAPYLLSRLFVRQPYTVAAVCGLLIATYAVGSYERNKAWANEITLWSDVLAKNPRTHRAHNNRGRAHKALGNMELALSDYSQAIELDPQDATVYFNRGNVYQILGQSDLAIDDYTKSLKIRPRYSASLNNRATIYLSQGKVELALADLNRIIDLELENPSAYLNRASSYRSLGNHDLALRDCNQAIQLDPTNPLAYTNRSIIYAETGKFELAISDCDKAIVLAPSYVPAYHNRVRLHLIFGQYGSAIEDCKRVLAIDPNNADALNNLAWILATCPDAQFRDGKAAIGYARRAAEITDWKDYRILGTLGAASAEASDYDEAVRWQKAALEQSPESDLPMLRERLDLYQGGQPYRERPNP